MRISEITEGITIDPSQNRLRFNYSDPSGVSTRMGKSKFAPYIKQGKTLDGYTVYSVYTSGDEATTDVLKSLKKKSSVAMTPEDYEHFLSRTSMFITAKILAPNQIDYVITPGSSTNILNDLLAHLKERNPHIRFLPESVIKTVDLSKITVDTEAEGITPNIVRSLTGILNAAIKTGKFEIKKALPQYRKFFKNFFQVVNPRIYEKLRNKNICVLDDVLSSGTTLVQIMKTVTDYGPANVVGTTVYKTK